MTIATHSRGAADRVAFADLDDVLFNAIAFWMVQMSVLHIVYVVSVTDSDMPAMADTPSATSCGRLAAKVTTIINAAEYGRTGSCDTMYRRSSSANRNRGPTRIARSKSCRTECESGAGSLPFLALKPARSQAGQTARTVCHRTVNAP